MSSSITFLPHSPFHNYISRLLIDQFKSPEVIYIDDKFYIDNLIACGKDNRHILTYNGIEYECDFTNFLMEHLKSRTRHIRITFEKEIPVGFCKNLS
jgi:hypothetical protein